MTEEELAAQAALEAAELQAAIARGDVIVPDKPAELDVDVLADIAKDDDVVVEIPATVPDKKDDGTIPRARFNEINDENKALKERLAALEVANAAPVQPATQQQNEYERLEAQRDELQAKADEMLFEGQLDERKPLVKQIRDIDRALAKAEVMYEVRQEMAQKETVATVNQVITAAEKEYPFLDPQSDAFDGDAVAVINNRQSELIKAGQSSALALHNAVIEKGPKLAKLLGVGTTIPDTSKGDEVKAAREKAAKEKAASASLNQPASLPSQTDKDKFAVNATTLTAKQILALPEADRAKAMGDTL